MADKNPTPGSMVIVGKGPDDQYAYDVPSVDGSGAAGGMFGDVIMQDIYRQQIFDFPKRAIIDQYKKEKMEIKKKTDEQVESLLKQISDKGKAITRQDRIDVMNAVLTKIRTDIEGYKKALGNGLNVDIDKGEASNLLYIRWQQMPMTWERRREFPFEQFAKEELERTVAYYKQDVLSDAVKYLASRVEEENVRLAEEKAAKIKTPEIPPGVSLDANLEHSKSMRQIQFMKGGYPALYNWFYGMVRNKGEWDYKQKGRQYEEFGNFNYGAVGTAAGIPEQILLRAAGAAQGIAGTSKEDFGKWWGDSPYGDDRIDQVWIKAGVRYAKSKGY
ncbi:polymorphic toxin type 44 domain-containing protein [Pseudomonas aeruginosa]|uniref:polymorphic toxin type 44 domain-containing protein n=1 Tax=Pseudomonas aeruginosa TaxID=287 RepID=UPI003FCEECC1